MSTIQFISTFEIVTCYKCGIQFAVTSEFNAYRRADHADFWCPGGHVQAYLCKSKAEKEADAANAAARQAQAQANEARHAQLVAEKARDAAIAEKKRLQARAARGVCLCCNRTFSDLQRHMKTKHKEALEPGKNVKQIGSAA